MIPKNHCFFWTPTNFFYVFLKMRVANLILVLLFALIPTVLASPKLDLTLPAFAWTAFSLTDICKVLVARLFVRLGAQEERGWPHRFERLREKVAWLLGIGEATVSRAVEAVRLEFRGSKVEETRGSKAKISDEDVDAMGAHIRERALGKQATSLNDLMEFMETEREVTASKATIWRHLKARGFTFGRGHQRCAPSFNADSIAFRNRYVVKFVEELVDSKGLPRKPIVVLDESYCNKNHFAQFQWLGPDRVNIRPCSDGRLWCFIGAGIYWKTDDKLCCEWVDDSFSQFLAVNKTSGKGKGQAKQRAPVGSGSSSTYIKEEYHGHFNGEKFMDWFKTLCKTVKEKHGEAVILMDGAGYHKQRLDNIPTSSSTVDTIKQWLNSQQIEFRENDLKSDLYKLVLDNKEEKIKYAAREHAKEHGHEVYYTPPYHPELQPIEIIWGVMKNPLARKVTTMKDLGDRISKSKESITEATWRGSWNKMMKFMKHYYDHRNDLPEEDGPEDALSEDDMSDESEAPKRKKKK